MKKYGVFENGKPCVIKNIKCWNNHVFSSFKKACEYASAWLDCYAPIKYELNKRYYFSGASDYIMINEISHKNLKTENKFNDNQIVYAIIQRADNSFIICKARYATVCMDHECPVDRWFSNKRDAIKYLKSKINLKIHINL